MLWWIHSSGLFLHLFYFFSSINHYGDTDRDSHVIRKKKATVLNMVTHLHVAFNCYRHSNSSQFPFVSRVYLKMLVYKRPPRALPFRIWANCHKWQQIQKILLKRFVQHYFSPTKTSFNMSWRTHQNNIWFDVSDVLCPRLYHATTNGYWIWSKCIIMCCFLLSCHLIFVYYRDYKAISAREKGPQDTFLMS